MVIFLSTMIACMVCYVCGHVLGYGKAERDQLDKEAEKIVTFTNEWVRNHPEFR